MASVESGTPMDKELFAHVAQQWASYPPKPINPPPKVLPEGMSEEKFEEVLEILRKALGEQNVVIGEEHRVKYSDPFQFETPEEDVGGSACALTPTSVEQVQEIVKIANAYSLTLWTFSRGKNLGTRPQF